MGLVIVLRTKELTGSFASAGIASGASALAPAALLVAGTVVFALTPALTGVAAADAAGRPGGGSSRGWLRPAR